ncbi:MAG: hypothetical protein A3E88_00755 [Legionellales bacterium RIFCSPHIGHO2_12_FULL_35_11]|nr:MAG: hypothetical protein A3E88_00755 [Legionellales bacterium RIFCSPHIGHO2_12_FULL_35_11]
MSINEHWQKLNDREQKFAKIGIIIVFIYIFYALIYSPLSSSVKQKKQFLQEQKEVYLWMKNASNIHKLAEKNPSAIKLNNISAVSQNLKSTNLKKFSPHLMQTNDGEINLSFEKVPYNEFLVWLWKISSKNGILIKDIDIVSKSNEDGYVSVKLLFSIKP